MIKEINEQDLLKMKDKEGLILQGCGGDLNDWLQGITEDFTKRNILMNNSKFEDIYSFKSGEITNLLFPLDNADVNVPKLAMWRIGTHEVFGGTWLSDYIDNRLSDKEEVVNNENQEVIKPDCELIGFRDPMGFRPLCIGKTDDGAYVIASESCALDTIGAKFIRDIAPGEIVTVSTEGVSSDTSHCGKCKGGMCVFEYIYFARPDSVIEGSSVQQARMRAGEFLAKESPVDADIVIGVPDSGLDAALGYSKESGIPYGVGFIKNKYIGRSFIQPSQDQREDAVRIKLNVVRPNIEGKRVIMIDDSIVRGTTCARIVALLREAGAKEVHMRVSSPPFKYPCYFGTDVDSQENLIACKYNSVEDIAKIIGVDSLAYLSIDATHKLAEQSHLNYCDGCFTGNYPVEVPKEQPKDKFETKLNRFSAYYQVLD